jgi:hypothetical protein
MKKLTTIIVSKEMSKRLKDLKYALEVESREKVIEILLEKFSYPKKKKL